MNKVLVFEAQQALQELAATSGVISNAKNIQTLKKDICFFSLIYPLCEAKVYHL